MLLHSIILNSTTDTGTSSCLQYAQEQNLLGQSLLIFGVFLPFFIWPFLPSTSEAVSYLLLAVSSAALFISSFLWSMYATRTNIDDTLRPSFRSVWVCLTGPFLYCCVTLGMIGYGGTTNKCGKKLGRGSFDVPAYVTLNMLPGVTSILGEYLLNSTSPSFTLAGFILASIVARPVTRSAMTMYYHFTTRRISLLHWLPQNGAEADFIPWWSHLLRFIWIGFTSFLVYFFLAMAFSAREC